MSDLIERLRIEPFNHWTLRHEAADRIEELEAKSRQLMLDVSVLVPENERLRERVAELEGLTKEQSEAIQTAIALDAVEGEDDGS